MARTEQGDVEVSTQWGRVGGGRCVFLRASVHGGKQGAVIVGEEPYALLGGRWSLLKKETE
jgi:hypothetical protein